MNIKVFYYSKWQKDGKLNFKGRLKDKVDKNIKRGGE